MPHRVTRQANASSELHHSRLPSDLPARVDEQVVALTNELFPQTPAEQEGSSRATLDPKLAIALGQLTRKRRIKRKRGFIVGILLCVVVPTLVVALYLYVFAANQYTAEFRFSVTETNPSIPGGSQSIGAGATGPAAAAAAAMSAIGGNLAGTIGSPNAAVQNYVIIDYLKSQQVVDELDKRIHIRNLYGDKVAGADWWAVFDEHLPLDRFLPYWNGMVSTQYDPIVGVATVRVRAFTPERALLIGDTLVLLAEELINEIAMRPMKDAIRYAEEQVEHAESRLERARRAVSDYRKSAGIVDPTGSIANNVALTQALRSQLSQLEVEFQTISAQQQNANAPILKQQSLRISAVRDALKKAEEEVSKSRGGAAAIADLAGKYEQLDLQRQYASAMVLSSMQALDQARANAAAQHYYLTPYVRPSLPSTPSYPKRLQTVVLCALGFLTIWTVGAMVARSVREHL